MHGLGFLRERQPFRPHVTLGRAHRSADVGSFREFERFARMMEFESSHPVTHIDVMRSRLTREGARYEVIKVARLQGNKA